MTLLGYVYDLEYAMEIANVEKFQKIFCINLPDQADRHYAMRIASAATGINLNFIDGVYGENVSANALPPGAKKASLSVDHRGGWRAHLNALEAVVEQNLSTALIFEDDIDWDVRIRDQLVNFAAGSVALTQPLYRKATEAYADRSYPTPRARSEVNEIYMDEPPPTAKLTTSPYGDAWDVLWLGHCGTNFPEPIRWPATPLGRAIFEKDETVPQPHHMTAHSRHAWEFSSDELETTYPNHTRVVHHAAGTTCALAYAVTQESARRLLYEFGVKKLNGPFDSMLSQYCDGKNGRSYHDCLTVKPALFKQHQPVGHRTSLSDVSTSIDDGYVMKEPFTNHIRYSTRINLPRILDGNWKLKDSFPDNEPPDLHV